MHHFPGVLHQWGDTRDCYLTDDPATGKAIFRILQPTVLVVQTASILAVAKIAKLKFKTLTVVSDSTEAINAANDLGVPLVPPSDWEGLPTPPEATRWLTPASDLIRTPTPVRWLVDGLVQEQGICMVHGPSGAGKTFLALDWSLRMSTGGGDWFGRRIKSGTVVYLAGEGHAGLAGRIAGWQQKNGKTNPHLFVAPGAQPLDTPQGLSLVRSHIAEIGRKIDLIVIDTVNKWMAGNDSASQDVGLFLRSCEALSGEFRCAVLLVHHTGLDPKSWGRSRGSSAWSGGLDSEISVTPCKKTGIQIAQYKVRDGELAGTLFAELESIQITGWGTSTATLIEARSTDERKEALARARTIEVADEIRERFGDEVDVADVRSHMSQKRTPEAGRQAAYRFIEFAERFGLAKKDENILHFTKKDVKKT